MAGRKRWLIGGGLVSAFLLSVGVAVYWGTAPDRNAHLTAMNDLASRYRRCGSDEVVAEGRASLTVSPTESFVDESINIQASNMDPFQVAGLRITVTDSSGNRWESLACFRADEFGEIDPGALPPLAGSAYEGVHAMGLFWSMMPLRLQPFSHATDLAFDIQLEVGRTTLATATATRRTYRDLDALGIDKVEIRNRIIANLYSGSGAGRKPAVILLAGSSGQFQPDKAVYLAARDYVVMDLQYVGMGPLPERLERIPLEYLDTAVRRLAAQPNVDSDAIALMGRSKGAEYALLYASYFDTVASVISVVGTHVAWSSKTWFRSSWTYQGREIPFARGSLREAIRYVRQTRHLGQNQLSYMQSALENRSRVEDAAIGVEDFGGRVLLLSGKDDQQWLSTAMSAAIVARARKHGFANDIEHQAYTDAGHEFDVLPNVPQPDFSQVATWRSGGTPQGNALAAIAAWERVLTFLDENRARPEFSRTDVDSPPAGG